MKVFPVIDIKDSRPVIAVAGERSAYQPVAGLTPGTSGVITFARMFQTRWDLKELYLADLDAIEGGEPHYEMVSALKAESFDVWVDAGIHNIEGARMIADAGAASIVLGLETIDSPDTLAAIAAFFGDRIVFSLDLKSGRPLGDTSRWQGSQPLEIAAQAISLGIRRLLILDLAHVGMNRGVGTGDLTDHLLERFPGVSFAVGGGVRGIEDLRMHKARGVQSVLVGSALRENRLTREELAELL